jgi:hypothetical protein
MLGLDMQVLTTFCDASIRKEGIWVAYAVWPEADLTGGPSVEESNYVGAEGGTLAGECYAVVESLRAVTSVESYEAAREVVVCSDNITVVKALTTTNITHEELEAPAALAWEAQAQLNTIGVEVRFKWASGRTPQIMRVHKMAWTSGRTATMPTTSSVKPRRRPQPRPGARRQERR